MPDNQDLMQIGQDALDEAKGLAVEQIRTMKAEVVNRPAFARELSREERLTSHRRFLSDAQLMDDTYSELAARFKLPPDKPIPRRLLDYGLLIMKELGDDATA